MAGRPPSFVEGIKLINQFWDQKMEITTFSSNDFHFPNFWKINDLEKKNSEVRCENLFDANAG